jgi:uncharacterized DUF497 family protein
MKFAGFDWDEANRSKCLKHRVSLAEIEQVFRSAPAVFPDPAHSRTEERLRAIGRTDTGRYVFVAFPLRRDSDGMVLVRPISARYMHDREVRHYERPRRGP